MSDFLFNQKPCRSPRSSLPSITNCSSAPFIPRGSLSVVSNPSPSPAKESNKLLKLLVLETFKVNPCSIKQNHNHKQCQFYHYPKDRKRRGEFYSADLCEFVERNQVCPYGDKCMKSHSGVEQLYRKEKYKMKFCSHYPTTLQICEYGEFCSFAHSEEELLVDLLHRMEKNEDFFIFKFKTVMCPFNSIPHDKAQCVYAHNWQDFRRKPNYIHYDPMPCAFWKPNDFLTIYNLGCPNGSNCSMCHGWKELDYHPLVYKTNFCPNGMKCHRTFECAHFHNENEKRIIDPKIQMGMFRYCSRNVFAENRGNSFEKNDNKFEQVKKPSSSNLPDIEQSPFSCLARSETRMPSSNSNGSFKHLDFSIPDKNKMTFSLRFNYSKAEMEINEFNEFDQISSSLNEIYLGDDYDDDKEQMKQIVENEKLNE